MLLEKGARVIRRAHFAGCDWPARSFSRRVSVDPG
jgi:hypothetical protein